jgi:hypothetical protein
LSPAPSEVFKRGLPPNQDFPILKIFLDLYVDDFGPFRSVYHPLGGVYLVLGYMPLDMRQELYNIFLIGFVPFGVNFDECIQPMVDEIKSLQQGVIWNLNGASCWVAAELLLLCLSGAQLRLDRQEIAWLDLTAY